MTPRQIVFTIGALLLGASPVAAQTDTVTVGVGGELSQVSGEYLLVPIFADMTKSGGERLGSYTARLTWDPSILYYESAEPGSFAQASLNTDSAYYGVLRVSAISPDGMDGVFDLVRLRYYTYGGTTPLDLSVTELSAAGTLRDLLATATVQEVGGTFCTALGRWGDMDFDGEANSRDALAILSHVVGIDVSTSFTVALGDVDGDGNTNTRDALILLSYAVGIDITGQRVMLTAPGACGTGTVPSISITPDTADIVVGQSVQLEAVTRDSAGQPTAVSGVNWSVADPAIAAVSPDGVLSGRTAGTTTVTAGLGPGVTLSTAVVVSARRTVWYVDAQTASQRPTQLGNQKYPFSTIQRAFPLASEGDTIRVAPGIHEYESSSSTLDVGVTILGDTLVDGTRPIVRAPPDQYYTALDWTGGVRGVLENLVFEGFDQVVYADGVRNITAVNVRIVDPRIVYGDAFYLYRSVDTLRVLNCELVGDSAFQSGTGIYVGDGAHLVNVEDTRITNWGGGGIYAYDVDSLNVQRSEIGPTQGYGVYAYAYNLPSTAVVVDQTRILDASYDGIYVSPARSVSLSGNYIYTLKDNAVTVYGVSPVVVGSGFRSVNDTILFRADDYDYLYAQSFDSVTVDGMVVSSPADTAMYQYGDISANHVAIKNSQFLNLYGSNFYVDARELVVDSSAMTGCAVCQWTSAGGFYTQPYMDSGPVARISNSSFYNLDYPYYNTNSGTKIGLFTFTGNTVDSVTAGFRTRADSIYVADNVMTRVRDYGGYSEQSYSSRPPVRAVFERNDVTCSILSGYTSYGIYAAAIPVTMDSNSVRDCDYGIYATYGTTYQLADAYVRGDSIFMASDGSGAYGLYLYGRFGYAEVRRNTVRRGTAGMYIYPSLLTGDTAVFRIDTNAVSQTVNQAIYMTQAGPVPSIIGVRNNISGNVGYGIQNAVGGTPSFTFGRFIGNGSYSVYSTVAFDATSNYWGDAAGGPVGPGGFYGTGTTLDSIYSAAVLWDTALATDPGDTPPLSPPSLGSSAPASSTAAPSAAGVPQEPQDDAQARRARRDAYEQRRAEREAAKQAEWGRFMTMLERIRAERRARGGGGNW